MMTNPDENTTEDTITINANGDAEVSEQEEETPRETIHSRKAESVEDEESQFSRSSHPAHPALWILTWLVLGAASSYSIFQWHTTKKLLTHYEARLEAIEGKTDEIPLYVDGVKVSRGAVGGPESARNEVAVLVDHVKRAQASAQNAPSRNLEEEYEKLALQAQLFDVGDRLEQLEDKLTTAVTQSFRENKQLVALIELHRKLRTGEPFPVEVNNLIEAAEEDGVIISNASLLTRYAEKGIRDRKNLYERFSPMAREIIIANHKASADDSFVERFKANMSEVITVRRVGENLAGDEVDAIVGRAELAMEQDDVERAVYELSKLEGKARQEATPWLEDAKALLTAEETFNALFQHIAKKQEKAQQASSVKTTKPGLPDLVEDEIPEDKPVGVVR